MIRFKYILVMLLLIVFASMCLAAETKKKPQVAAEEENFKKIEFGFFFGPGISQFDFTNFLSDSYSEFWVYDSYYWLDRGAYSSSIVGDAEMGCSYGVLFNYFFHKNFGVQFMLERSHHDVLIEASHSVVAELSYNGESSYYSADPPIADTVERLATIPISFNGIARFDIRANISGYASGGLTYYKTDDIETKSQLGYGFPFYLHHRASGYTYLLYDSILVPVSIEDSLSGAGSNIGGGVVITIQKNVGIFTDFRYYRAPKKDVYWTLQPGSYPYLMDYWFWLDTGTKRLSDVSIQLFMQEYGELLKVEVNPSFYRLAFGLKFSF